MILKYIPQTKNSPDLDEKVLYKVISINFVLNAEIASNYNVRYRVVNKKGLAALYDQHLFSVLNPDYDTDFIFKPSIEGSFELIPEIMSYPNFWIYFLMGILMP